MNDYVIIHRQGPIFYLKYILFKSVGNNERINGRKFSIKRLLFSVDHIRLYSELVLQSNIAPKNRLILEMWLDNSRVVNIDQCHAKGHFSMTKGPFTLCERECECKRV